MEYKKLEQKKYSYLQFLFDTDDTKDIYEFITNSKIYIAEDDYARFRSEYALLFSISPGAYKKFHGVKKDIITEKIREQLDQAFGFRITSQDVKPDLSQFEFIGNNYKPVITPWGEINILQSNLITQFENSNNDIDFQNVGNTCRTIMQKLADIVFIPSKHIADGFDLSAAKFKNRLHTVIDTELKGSKLKEIRKYASSLIDTVENAIDLSNNLTHDLDADRMIAESCLIGTISAIGIIKVINNKIQSF